MQSNVCVVGGGIVGLSSAYFLAKTGHSVTVIERDSIGSHASGFAYGSLSPLGEAGQAEDILPELEIARMGMDIHTQFSRELFESTGINSYTCGHMILLRNVPALGQKRERRACGRLKVELPL